jgi:hypothetical protein
VLYKSEEIRTATADNAYVKYLKDPVRFANEALGVYLTPLQAEAAQLLLQPPYRVLVPSANEQGKTFLGAVIALWWHLCYRPSIVLTTAPNKKQIKNLLWKEIRRLSRGHPIKFAGPEAIRAARAADDYMEGYTARNATEFQGHHGPNQLIIFDEATGLRGEFFEAAETMFSPPNHAWIVFFNPTDITQQVYREYTSAGRNQSWHIVRMNALQHPNIAAGLRGEPPPVQHALRIEGFERRLKQWCHLVREDEEPKATDICWPPQNALEYQQQTNQKPRYWRPGPIAECRLFAQFPSQSVNSIWSDGDWHAALRLNLPPLEIPLDDRPEIGVDVARFGLDWTAFHVRCGPCALHHEEYNGQDGATTEARIKELAQKWARWQQERSGSACAPEDVNIKIDDDGIGGTICDNLLADGYAVTRVVAKTASFTKDYPNRRSEMWFLLPELARNNQLDLSRLKAETLDRLHAQAFAAKYYFNAKGQRVVTAKDEMRVHLGSSPDGMDAMNLAFAPSNTGGVSGPVVGNVMGSKKVKMRY